MYYNYHAKNIKRIKQGELIGILESEDEKFAFILLFSTYPFTRPIRHHALERYIPLLKDDAFQAFFHKKD